MKSTHFSICFQVFTLISGLLIFSHQSHAGRSIGLIRRSAGLAQKSWNRVSPDSSRFFSTKVFSRNPESTSPKSLNWGLFSGSPTNLAKNICRPPTCQTPSNPHADPTVNPKSLLRLAAENFKVPTITTIDSRKLASPSPFIIYTENIPEMYVRDILFDITGDYNSEAQVMVKEGKNLTQNLLKKVSRFEAWVHDENSEFFSELRSELEPMISKLEDLPAEERIAAIIYLTNNLIKYSDGYGTSLSNYCRPFNQVIETGKGCCMDFALLAATFARAIGIKEFVLWTNEGHAFNVFRIADKGHSTEEPNARPNDEPEEDLVAFEPQMVDGRVFKFTHILRPMPRSNL